MQDDDGNIYATESNFNLSDPEQLYQELLCEEQKYGNFKIPEPSLFQDLKAVEVDTTIPDCLSFNDITLNNANIVSLDSVDTFPFSNHENESWNTPVTGLNNSYENLPVPNYTVPAETPVSIPVTVDQPRNSPSNSEETTIKPSSSSDGCDAPMKNKRNRRRTKAPKRKLYEVDTPFEDEKEERKRLNAIKAKKNREKRDQLVDQLKAEKAMLEKVIKDKDSVIDEQSREIQRLKQGSTLKTSKLYTLKSIVDDLYAESAENTKCEPVQI